MSALRQGAGITHPPLAVSPVARAAPRVAGPLRPTLQVTLLTLVLGLLLATIGALATIDHTSHARSIEDLESRYFDLASETVAMKLRALLEPATPTLQEAVYEADTAHTLAIDDDVALQNYALARIRFTDSLTWFYYGAAASGRFVGARKE